MKLIIIGAGPAGYTAAFTAAKAKWEVLLFTNHNLGGVCLNEGCIPTKSLLEDSFHLYKTQLMDNELNPIKSVIPVYQHKSDVQLELQTNLEKALIASKVQVIHSKVHFISNTEVMDHEGHRYTADKFLICTGAKPSSFIQIDGALTSYEVLDQPITSKQSILIIGAGVIGVELASFLRMMSHEVTLIELAPRILSQVPKEAAQTLDRELKRMGIQIFTNTKVDSYTKDSHYHIEFNNETHEYDQVIIATGRIANTNSLQLQNTDIETERGYIKVNSNFETSVKNIYACGDVAGSIQLAHVASDQAEQLIHHLIDNTEILNKIIPYVIYTPLQIAYAGLSEEKAKELNINYKVKKVLFNSIAKQKIKINTRAYLKCLINENYEMIGCEIVSSEASELISTCLVIMENKLDCREIHKTVYAHPSLSEVFKDISFEL